MKDKKTFLRLPALCVVPLTTELSRIQYWPTKESISFLILQIYKTITSHNISLNVCKSICKIPLVNISKVGEGWLGFPDLWSGQKPWCNWYLTLVVNFGEVGRSQLPNPLSSPPHWCTWDFSDLLRSVQMLKRESGVRKATGSYRTYLIPVVKLQPGFLRLQWRTCRWAEHSWW